MVNECIRVEIEQCSRGQLQKFASNVKYIETARKNSPYHRAEAQNEFHQEYFEHLRQRYAEMKADPNRLICFTRYRLPNKFVFDSSNALDPPVLVEGLFRPDEENHVQFANKNVGGGFMTYGLADEEVRCLERPDMGMFIAAKYRRKVPITIAANEALVLTGADICAGVDFYGRVPEDWPARCCYFESPKVVHGSLVIIDCIRPRWKKYKQKHLQWCIKKAYCGFQGVATTDISTGPWGCGAFFNNRNVMFCVQTLAAWLAGKKLLYHGHGTEKGYDMVMRWHEGRTPFKVCFKELVATCKTDPDFETAWNPELVQQQFSQVQMQGHLEAEEFDSSAPRVMKIQNFTVYAEKKWEAYGGGAIKTLSADMLGAKKTSPHGLGKTSPPLDSKPPPAGKTSPTFGSEKTSPTFASEKTSPTLASGKTSPALASGKTSPTLASGKTSPTPSDTTKHVRKRFRQNRQEILERAASIPLPPNSPGRTKHEDCRPKPSTSKKVAEPRPMLLPSPSSLLFPARPAHSQKPEGSPRRQLPRLSPHSPIEKPHASAISNSASVAFAVTPGILCAPKSTKPRRVDPKKLAKDRIA